MMITFWRKAREFNSRSYDLDLVKDDDEFRFLRKTLNSFIESGIVLDSIALISETNKANLHVATNNKTLIKWLKKFGFEEAK